MESEHGWKSTSTISNRSLANTRPRIYTPIRRYVSACTHPASCLEESCLQLNYASRKLDCLLPRGNGNRACGLSMRRIVLSGLCGFLLLALLAGTARAQLTSLTEGFDDVPSLFTSTPSASNHWLFENLSNPPRRQHRLRDFGLGAFPPSLMTLRRLVPQTRSSHKRLKVD